MFRRRLAPLLPLTLRLRSNSSLRPLLCIVFDLVLGRIRLLELLRGYLPNDGQTFFLLGNVVTCWDNVWNRPAVNNVKLKWRVIHFSLLLEDGVPMLARLSVLQESKCFHVRVGLRLLRCGLGVLVGLVRVEIGNYSHVRRHLPDEAVARAARSASMRPRPELLIEGEHVLRTNFAI